MQAGFYDENGDMVQLMETADYKEVGELIVPLEIHITPLTIPGNKTILRLTHYDFDVQLEENFFSLQNMKRQW